MRLLIKKCDRCGAIISEQEFDRSNTHLLMPGKYSIEFRELVQEAESKAETKTDAFEICDECAVAFLDWLKKKDAPVVKSKLLDIPKDLTIPEKRPIKLKPGTRTYHTWTDDEDDFLLHHSAGLTLKQMAYKLGVTVAAVQCHRYRLLNGGV